MNLIWKGRYTNEQQLLVGSLPINAVKFKEPSTPLMLNLVASIFVIPVIIIIGIAFLIKAMIQSNILPVRMFNIWGILLGFIMIIPHEILHAAAFPKNAEVQLWYSPKNMMAFVFSPHPTSKMRFIFLSLLPNIVLGLIPLIIWIFIPFELAKASEILFSFASISLLFGVGDYLNVYNASIQMPKGSMTQLYGFNSYWYMPEK